MKKDAIKVVAILRYLDEVRDEMELTALQQILCSTVALTLAYLGQTMVKGDKVATQWIGADYSGALEDVAKLVTTEIERSKTDKE